MPSTVNADNGVSSGSVGLKYASDNSGVLALQTNGNTAVTITSANNVGIGTTSPDSLLHVVNPLSASIRVGYAGGSTNYYDASVHTFRANTGSPSVFVANQYGIGLGTVTPSSGMGIAFPAAQVASSDPNTLDDYEEGTFTPIVYGGSSTGTTTYSSQYGKYTRIGNVVTISAQMDWTSATGTGSMQIGGFPFTSSSTTGINPIGTVMMYNIAVPASSIFFSLYTNGNNTVANIYANRDNNTWTAVQMDSNAILLYTLTYFTA